MKIVFWIVVVVVVFFWLVSLYGSNSSGSYSSGRFDEYSGSDEVSTYNEDKSDEITSDNWECTSDCSGHEAGYDWAADNGITDPSECDGNSDSFIEGCVAYANEYQDENESEYDEDYTDYEYNDYR